MPVKVIDASAVAAVLFNEPDAEKVLDQIAGDSLVAPSLVTLELANVCLKKIRARPHQRDSLLIAFQLMARLDIEVSPIDHADVIVLAESTGLTFYDACYLWLAKACQCELLTLDKKLAAAARK